MGTLIILLTYVLPLVYTFVFCRNLLKYPYPPSKFSYTMFPTILEEMTWAFLRNRKWTYGSMFLVLLYSFIPIVNMVFGYGSFSIYIRKITDDRTVTIGFIKKIKDFLNTESKL